MVNSVDLFECRMRNEEYQMIFKSQAQIKPENQESYIHIYSVNNEKPLKILRMGLIMQ